VLPLAPRTYCGAGAGPRSASGATYGGAELAWSAALRICARRLSPLFREGGFHPIG
jgi:hypothetical protein